LGITYVRPRIYCWLCCQRYGYKYNQEGTRPLLYSAGNSQGYWDISYIMKVRYLNSKGLFCAILFFDYPGFYNFAAYHDVPGVTFIRVCGKSRIRRTEFAPELVLVVELRLSHGRVLTSIQELPSDLNKGRRRRACRAGQFPELFFNWGPRIALARSCEITTKQCQNHQTCTQAYASQLGALTIPNPQVCSVFCPIQHRASSMERRRIHLSVW
jgi:hypothetical protein